MREYHIFYWILYSSVLIGLIYIQFGIPIYPITFIRGCECMANEWLKRERIEKIWCGKYSNVDQSRKRKTIIIRMKYIRISCPILFDKIKCEFQLTLARMSHHYNLFYFNSLFESVVCECQCAAFCLSSNGTVTWAHRRACPCLPDEHLIY